MSHCKPNFRFALAVLAGVALAQPAQAIEINRNTGVGLEIAAQGNAALRAIEAAIHIVMPALPKPKARATPVAAQSGPNGVVLRASALRCAE